MHISCSCAGLIDRSHKQTIRHHISTSRSSSGSCSGILKARKLLLSSYVIALIYHTISRNNFVTLDARPCNGLQQPGLSNNRTQAWNVSAEPLNGNYRPSFVPAVTTNRLQAYQLQLRQPRAFNPEAFEAQQQQPLPSIRQLTSRVPQQTRRTQQHSAGSSQHTPHLGPCGNATRSQSLIHHQQTRQANYNQDVEPVLRQASINERNQKQQVFEPPTTNKQVVQPQSLQQNPHLAYTTQVATKSVPLLATTTTTTIQPVYKNSDVTQAASGTSFSCLGCDPKGWPLIKSLVSLQNPRLMGGDILMRTSKRRPISTGIGRLYKFSRSALVDPVSLWPNGIIYYELDESAGHLSSLIWHVMQQFHVHTCIRFVARPNSEPDFIRIAAHKGCFSYIGRIGGEQVLSLGDGCEFAGTVAHELLHAIGFYHHQNRSDRDDYLEILWENVAKGKEDQFRKMSPEENFILNEFDYNSIMLYGPHTFGKTLDKVTMKPKRKGVILLELIEKRGLSELDIGSVNKLYKCELGYNLALDQPAASS